MFESEEKLDKATAVAILEQFFVGLGKPAICTDSGEWHKLQKEFLKDYDHTYGKVKEHLQQAAAHKSWSKFRNGIFDPVLFGEPIIYQLCAGYGKIDIQLKQIQSKEKWDIETKKNLLGNVAGRIGLLLALDTYGLSSPYASGFFGQGSDHDRKQLSESIIVFADCLKKTGLKTKSIQKRFNEVAVLFELNVKNIVDNPYGAGKEHQDIINVYKMDQQRFEQYKALLVTLGNEYK